MRSGAAPSPGPREIWILRHAEAEPATASGGDGARPLTAAGEADARALGRLLASRGLRAARVIASPLVRARETARLAASAGLAAPGVVPEEDRRLAPGGDAEGLARECLDEGLLPAVLVGHNPDLGDLVATLGGAALRLKKGMLVRIAFAGGRGSVVESLRP